MLHYIGSCLVLRDVSIARDRILPTTFSFIMSLYEFWLENSSYLLLLLYIVELWTSHWSTSLLLLIVLLSSSYHHWIRLCLWCTDLAISALIISRCMLVLSSYLYIFGHYLINRCLVVKDTLFLFVICSGWMNRPSRFLWTQFLIITHYICRGSCCLVIIVWLFLLLVAIKTHKWFRSIVIILCIYMTSNRTCISATTLN
jgi:hypothetical protein